MNGLEPLRRNVRRGLAASLLLLLLLVACGGDGADEDLRRRVDNPDPGLERQSPPELRDPQQVDPGRGDGR